MNVECYAQRLLNPFRGAMHTVKLAAAEAVTVDGLHWDIYVSDDSLLEGLDRALHAQVGDIRYGRWSQAKGLRRGPLNPSEDFRRMEALGDAVYEALVRRHRQVPFAFRDDYELWLLDADGRPLALLHSVIEESDITFDHATEWRAGYAARERFTSAVLPRLGAGNAGDYLTRYVNRHAGGAPSAQWFRREPDGGGAGLAGIRLPRALEGRRLAPADFPPLPLADIGHDDAHRQLIQDYHAWQSVWLLVLPGLDPDLRGLLERQLRRQTALVESQFRLYPDTVDSDAITSARVEAVLRASAARPGGVEEALPTFYIELNPYTYE